MKKILFLFSLGLICTLNYSYPKSPAQMKQDYEVNNADGTKRSYHFEFGSKQQDPEDLLYYSKHRQANPFIPHLFTTLTDTLSKGDKIIYSSVYHTGVLGLRLTPNSIRNSSTHLILSGDSNMFGLGVSDTETLAAQLASKINSHFVYNMGLAGAGPNHALYFLENYDLRKILDAKTKGLFIYDFHYYLFERVIGSKRWISMGDSSPRYIVKDGKLTYAGTFNHYWLSTFYKFLNLLPYNSKLIPNLPRISHSHMELTAKLMAKMKEEYLRQTDSQNRFIVMMNPAYGPNLTKEDIRYFSEYLNKLKIETVQFLDDEILPLPKLSDEGHLNATAHANYSQMIIKKLNLH